MLDIIEALGLLAAIFWCTAMLTEALDPPPQDDEWIGRPIEEFWQALDDRHPDDPKS